MTINFVVSFDETYYSEADPTASGPAGSATSPEVPSVWDVAIGGHGYMLDLGGENNPSGFHHESIPTLRPVFIEGDSLGEKDINPESLWRFSDRDWSHGSGQRYADLPTSDTSMFWQSKGIDPWTEWQISLLPDTTQFHASANSNLDLLAVGEYLYHCGGATVTFTADFSAYTSVTGLPGGAITGLCTDGFNIWIGVTGGGIWTTTRGASTATQYVTGTETPGALAYVNGRLMVSVGPSIYNITATGALPTALFEHANTDWQWVGFAAGQAAIYAGGFSADHSDIYQIGIASDGTTLTVPILAAPDLIGGETLLSIGSYEGFVFAGTNTGVRMCIPDSSGNLSVGSLLQTGPSRCFTGYDRFVWFGWDNFDSESTGLGRLDLSVESSSGAPAYASDLMASAQAEVVAVDTFNGQTVFAVNGIGFYVVSTNLVDQGFIDSGLITYDIPDPKIALYLTVRPAVQAGTQQAWISTDEGVFQFVGEFTATSQTDTYSIPSYTGFTFEIREVLVRDTTFTTLGPVVNRHMLQSLPAVDSGFFFYVPVFLAETVTVHGGGERTMDVNAERDFLYSLRNSSQRVIYQEMSSSWAVSMDDLTWTPTHITNDLTGFNGTLMCKLKTI